MPSQQSQDTPKNLHTIKIKGMNMHNVLSKAANIEILQKLLDQGEQPCCQCFILAARTKKLELVKKLLEIKPSGINTQNKKGKSLLSYFARQAKDLLQLLKMGANPVVKDIKHVLDCVILNTKNKGNEVIKILNIVTGAGVKLEDINDVHTFKRLVYKSRILKHVLDLGVSINPNMPGIHNVMKTITIQYQHSSRLPILTQVLTKLSEIGVNLVDDDGITLLKYCSQNFRSIKTLIKLGAPLDKPYIHRVLKTIVSKSYSQADISDGCDLLNLIVNRGHQLVDKRGNSLINYCTSNEMLLYLLRSGADPNVPQIHILLKSFVRTCSDHGDLKEILSIVAAAGVQLVDRKGRSLIKISKSTDIVCHLLQLGALPFHDGENLIREMLRNSGSRNYVKDLKLLIDSGFSILDEDKHGCTFLCSAIEICVGNTNRRENIDASCELVRYILNQRGIRDNHFKLNCEPGYHPQDILARCHRLQDSRITRMILTSKFKDTRRVTSTVLTNCHPADMSFVSLYMNNHDYYNISVKDIDYLYKQYGFSVNDPGVSLLTVVLKCYNDKSYLIQPLLQRGVNVEQRILVSMYEDVQDLKYNLKIPDAILMAAYTEKSWDVFKLLLPHAAFPPLALLLFVSYSYYNWEFKIKWFGNLLSLGRVPHGTQAYRAIREKVREMADKEDNQVLLLPVELDIPDQVGGIKSQELTMFDVAHRSPLSLLELSRYAVKMCLADTAAASNTQSLPQLFKSLLPPGLTDQLIAHKIEQVRNSEVKWLSNEDELLKNPPSLIFANCVSNMAGGQNKRQRLN